MSERVSEDEMLCTGQRTRQLQPLSGGVRLKMPES